MNLNNMFNPSDLSASASTLYDLSKDDDNVISAINYHQILQYRKECRDRFDKSKTDAELLEDIIESLDNGTPPILTLHVDQNAPDSIHVVMPVGYELNEEKISFRLWDGVKSFDGYIQIYDTNKPNEEVKMYFNMDEHTWYISNYTKCANWMPNISLCAVVSDLDILTKDSLYSAANQSTTTAPNITTAPVTTTTAAPIETTTLPETTTSAPVTTTAASFTTVVPGSEVSAKDDDEGVMIYYTRGSGELPAYFEIPSEYEGKPVYGVADNGFASMQELVHVKIPDTVILIGKNVREIPNTAFYSMSALAAVLVDPGKPSGLIGIDDYAFDCCSVLKNVILPDTVTNLGSGAFRAAGLQSVQFSNKLAIMGQECFHNCDALTEITLPATLKTVGKQAFYNCDNLKSATVAGPVCSELMFGECPKLESVTFLDPNCNIYSYSNTVCNEMAAPTRGMYNGVIRGYVGSTAQKYAESWNYRFEPLDPENYVTTSPAITTLPTATTTAVTTTAVTTAAAGKADIGFEISEDAWSFDSDSSSFFRENKAGVYERLLTASDFQTLKDFCSGLDWYGMGGISDHLVEHGNGTCYGMALTALMNHLHMFRPSDLDASAETLKKLNKENETVISAINYHQLLQYRVACQEAIDQGKTDARLFNDLLALAEAGKPAFVILSNDYKDPIKSHAVLAIGCKRYAEKISLNLWDGGHEFDGYIRLYDPTKPHEEVKMYFSQEEHEWYLDNAKFQKCGNWENNIALRAVFSEWDVLTKGSLFIASDSVNEGEDQTQITVDTAGDPNEPELIDPNTGKPSVGASSADVFRKRNVFSINGTGGQTMEKYVVDSQYSNDKFRFSFPAP